VKLSFIQNRVITQKFWHFLYRDLNLPLHFNLEMPHVFALSHLLSYFPTMILSSLHLVFFLYPYFTHLNMILEVFIAMNSALHFLYIYHLDFLFDKIFLPSNSQQFSWNKQFLNSFMD
jgi:hypothetical protein